MLAVSTRMLVVFWPGLLCAAVIRGSVVENQTSKPLARAVVTLQPVQGTPGGAQTVRTDSYGAFAFSSLAAGAYAVRVSRVGFLPTDYGQKRWNAAGTPVLAQRVDLAGKSSPVVLPLTNSRAMLFPGRWELRLSPPPGFYVSGFSGPRPEANSHPEGWNEITISNFGLVKFSLTAGGGSLHGIVKTLGDAVAGAPVHWRLTIRFPGGE